MSKNNRHKPERFVKLRYWLLDSPAWQSLPGGACALYVKMVQRYNGSNNGRIPFSLREAMQAVHVSKGMAKYLLDVLQDRGFIVCSKRGVFSQRTTTREASEWRLTEYDNDAVTGYATKEFMRWRPPEAKESPSEFKARTRRPFTRRTGLVHLGERSGSPRRPVQPKKGPDRSPRRPVKAKNDPPTVHPETHSIATRRRGPSPEAGEVADAPASEDPAMASDVTTTKVGRSGDTVEVVHDRERCYGYLRPWGASFKARWSGERFDDHYIGEFTTRAAAIDAVVNAATATDRAA